MKARNGRLQVFSSAVAMAVVTADNASGRATECNG